ncbi:MAG: GT4 family glycosyltransferase PelF [Aggregatilineaceae bacterium]
MIDKLRHRFSRPAAASATKPQADVTLLLEGTFPYVSGGVSSWVNQIIRGFPDLSFAVVFLGSRPEDYGDMKYQIPDNVVALETHYLFGKHEPLPVRAVRGDPKVMAAVRRMHERFRARADDPYNWLTQVVQECRPGGALDQDVFLYSRAAWDYITEMFRAHCTDPSFTDYFWTVRNIHAPIWQLVRIAMEAPPGRVYHTVSTGYAGFLGAMLKLLRRRPLLLSEHGIYTKERRIDLYQAQWIPDNRNIFERDFDDLGYFQRIWIHFFEALGRVTYSMSDDIIALYETNRLRQISEGAPPERTRNIPNGIDIGRFAPLRTQRPVEIPPVFCLIGRVVPIKDIKTFIYAARVAISRLPEAEAWIAGPEDEDPDYAEECRQLAHSLGLEDKVRFLGFQKMTELLPKVGVVVLSSISEGLPLVVLESFAAGVPVVTTDVGSCRQLIYGLTPEDQALGAAGHVVGITDSQALAEAVHHLLTDADAWRRASAAAIARVETYYTQEIMFNSYRTLYQRLLLWPASDLN